MPAIVQPSSAAQAVDARTDHVQVSLDLAHERRREAVDAELTGWGEMIVALATIGTLLLTVWVLVAFGVLEGGASPSLPDEFEFQNGDAVTGDSVADQDAVTN